jgi:threonine dehydratase
VDIQADNMIDRDEITQTERLIRPHVRRTPVIKADAADFGLSAARLKFKLRSARSSPAARRSSRSLASRQTEQQHGRLGWRSSATRSLVSSSRI